MASLSKNTTEESINRSQEIASARAKLFRLAKERGLKPLENPDALASGFWDDADEAHEDFDTWLRRLRSEGNGSRLQ